MSFGGDFGQKLAKIGKILTFLHFFWANVRKM